MPRYFKVLCTMLFLMALLVGKGISQVPACTPAQAERADTEIDRLHAWDDLYKWYKAYQHCDDGVLAEGYSEAVARVLVDHWSTLPRLAQLGRKSADFRKFVLLHVDATLDTNDIEKIRANAQTKCPAGLRSLCRDLRSEAVAALKQ